MPLHQVELGWMGLWGFEGVIGIALLVQVHVWQKTVFCMRGCLAGVLWAGPALPMHARPLVSFDT